MRLRLTTIAGRVALVGALLVLALGVAGCSAGVGASRGAPVRVVAAENVWGSIAEQLGGEKAQVTSLVSRPNADPHDYEPTVADARAVARAGLVVANGGGYDAWLGKLVAANPDASRVSIDVAQLAMLPAGGNPHLWYSQGSVRATVDAITDAYKRLDPADSAYFDARRVAYLGEVARISTLVSAIASDYAGVPIGASESVVVPLAGELHLRLLTPPTFLSAIGEGVDPSLADKAVVDAQIRERRIKVFVYNPQNSTPDVLALVAEAKAAGIPVVTVTETLQPARATYQDWQVTQLEALRAALAKATGRN